MRVKEAQLIKKGVFIMSAISSYGGYGSGYSVQSVRHRPSEEEMAARRKEMFSKVDGNGDGGIDKTELSDFLSKRPGGSSAVSNLEEKFSEFDADGSGTLSQEEMDNFMKSLRSEMKSNMNKARFGEEQGVSSMPPPPPSDKDASGDENSSLGDTFSSIDANGDGVIDSDEFSNVNGSQLKKIISAYMQQMSSSYSSQATDSVFSSLSA